MSIKIFLAYTSNIISLRKLDDIISQIKIEANNRAKQEIYKIIAHDYVVSRDLEYLNDKKTPLINNNEYFNNISNFYFESLDSKKHLHDYRLHFSCSILYKVHKNKLYWKITSTKDILTKCCISKLELSIPNFKKYEYWDNNDKPDNISYKTWAHRKKIWFEIFKDSFYFSNVMNEIIILSDHNPYPYLEIEFLQPHLPKLLKRVNDGARQIYINSRIKELNLEEKSISNTINSLIKFEHDMKTVDIKKYYQIRKECLEKFKKYNIINLTNDTKDSNL